MNKLKLMLWGREFNLDITYDCYSDEEVLDSQKQAIKSFSSMSKEIESSLEKVKEYCLLNNKEDIDTDVIDNIFKYVAPKYLFVPRDEKKQIIAVMCNYKFDTESGIAVVFEDGKYKETCKQESIL